MSASQRIKELKNCRDQQTSSCRVSFLASCPWREDLIVVVGKKRALRISWNPLRRRRWDPQKCCPEPGSEGSSKAKRKIIYIIFTLQTKWFPYYWKYWGQIFNHPLRPTPNQKKRQETGKKSIWNEIKKVMILIMTINHDRQQNSRYFKLFIRHLNCVYKNLIFVVCFDSMVKFTFLTFKARQVDFSVQTNVAFYLGLTFLERKRSHTTWP